MKEHYISEVHPQERPMTVGMADPQTSLFDDMSQFCDKKLA